MDLPAYLTRIGVTMGSPAPPPSLSLLSLIMSAHSRAISFENVEVVKGNAIDMSDSAIFEKLVTRSRGGYCFEQNPLLLWALRSLGFDAVPVLCRVRWGKAPDQDTAFTHIALIVTLDSEQWLTDVGFAVNNSIEPIRVSAGPQKAMDGTFRVEERPDGYTWFEVENRKEAGKFLALYKYRTVRWETYPDLECMNHFSCRFPSARFTNQLFVATIRDASKWHILNTEMVERSLESGEVLSTTKIESEARLLLELREKFGLEVEAGGFDKIFIVDSN